MACLFLPAASSVASNSAANQTSVLSSENIANRALSVAENTRTSGYCYAAVSRALDPLGLNLTGGAAYDARAILLNDKRFIPIAVRQVDELRRGDIIVYNRSSHHPYGHIAVYEGNDEEASDHLSQISSTEPYGGATVFRLRASIDRSSSSRVAEEPPPREEPPRDVVPALDRYSRDGHKLMTADNSSLRSLGRTCLKAAERPIERMIVRHLSALLSN
jgi:hypothetical protein